MNVRLGGFAVSVIAVTACGLDADSRKSGEEAVTPLKVAPSPSSTPTAPPPVTTTATASPTPTPQGEALKATVKPKAFNASDLVPIALLERKASNGEWEGACAAFRLKSGVLATSGHCVVNHTGESCGAGVRFRWLGVEENGSLAPSTTVSTCQSMTSFLDSSRTLQTDAALASLPADDTSAPVSSLLLRAKERPFYAPLVYWVRSEQTGEVTFTPSYGYVLGTNPPFLHNGFNSTGTSGMPVFENQTYKGSGTRSRADVFALLATGVVDGLHYGVAAGGAAAVDAVSLKAIFPSALFVDP